jgi:Formylmethanofuran dehydrogenase subunit E
MNVGKYTVEEYLKLITAFHGYPAPGLLLGGYMVEYAKSALPEGTLFEAVVETRSCLPDAVQILTPCSTGNQWMKVTHLGRYALSLFDKYTGEGVRVHVDAEKLRAFPEMEAWFLKLKPKAEQDVDELRRQMTAAGHSVCSLHPVLVHRRYVGHGHMGKVALCPQCGEYYPSKDGLVCRGCQGEAPYVFPLSDGKGPQKAFVNIVPLEEAVGKHALHDMIRIVPGETKNACITAGHKFTSEDLPLLRSIGRNSVAVKEGSVAEDDIHENEAALRMAPRMAGGNLTHGDVPDMGRISFKAEVNGVFTIDRERLVLFNSQPDFICATRQDGTFALAGTVLASTRIIPLYTDRESMSAALGILNRPLFAVLPTRKARVGILVTGSEVYDGIIEDRFIPIVSAKVKGFGCDVAHAAIVPDDQEAFTKVIREMRDKGVDLLVTTGGLSVDPSDITRQALFECGLMAASHGAPVLPGSMSLVGWLPAPGREKVLSDRILALASPLDPLQPEEGEMQVLGVPAGALYHKTTLFDLLLQWALAGRQVTAKHIAQLGEGGLCMGCKECTWPKCGFMK